MLPRRRRLTSTCGYFYPSHPPGENCFTPETAGVRFQSGQAFLSTQGPTALSRRLSDRGRSTDPSPLRQRGASLPLRWRAARFFRHRAAR